MLKKSDFLNKAENFGNRKCLREPRKSFGEHPDAIYFGGCQVSFLTATPVVTSKWIGGNECLSCLGSAGIL